jgi:hypothetical protein
MYNHKGYLHKGYSRDDNSALTTISFPAFSGLLATFMAAAAAAPDEIPTYTKFANLQMAQDSKVHFKNNDELPCSIMLPSATFMGNGFVSS